LPCIGTLNTPNCAPVNEGQHATASRHGRPLRIIQAGIAQRVPLDVQVIEPRLAVDAAAEHDGAAIVQPGPAAQLGRFVGQLLGRTARGRHPPQIAQLRIAHEHQPLPIGRVARRVVEVILVDAVRQRAPLTTGQVQHADATVRVAPDHAAEHQAATIGRPVEAEQLGAIAARGLAQRAAGGAGDQHLAATVGGEPCEGDLATIRRPAREAIDGTGRRRQQRAPARCRRSAP
jgi:hypothetical protein